MTAGILVPLYSLALLTGAFLLFLVQPMVGKMLLPPLGGSPAVWTTCMVFFQCMLLAGYSYAHLSIRLLGRRRQAVLTVAIAVVSLLALPLAVGHGEPDYDHPTVWLLGQLLTGAGLLFFVVATGAPTLQSWYHASGHADAEDPYFLYAASNTGSLSALLAYPLIVEPLFSLDSQAFGWALLFGVWVLLVAGCAWTLRGGEKALPAVRLAAAPTGTQIAWWIGLAFVPSSLMLGVTTYMTHDIAAVPLLWVVPLALYLLTFILVFGRRNLISEWLMLKCFPYAVLLMLVVSFGGTVPSVHLLLIIPLAGFFCIAMLCHRELFRRRPPGAQLTAFYFWLAVGGAAGGLFNGIVAPLVFDGVAEYPLVILLACVLMAVAGRQRLESADVWLPALLLAAALAVEVAARSTSWFEPDTLRMLLAAAIVLAVFSWRERRYRFAAGALVLLLAGAVHERLERGTTVLHERNFFGIKRVVTHGDLISLWHGNTLHGSQFIAGERRLDPLAYYSRQGPLGDFFTALPPSDDLRLAAVGLGAGSIASYATPGQTFVFYEIDPAVARLARGENFFTFLERSRGQMQVVIGDGRLQLASAPEASFDVIVIDAFSSDSVPTHLLTVEALEVYESRLAPGGLLAFHMSNRYLRLPTLIGNLAARHELAGLVRRDETLALREGLAPSTWVVLARDPGRLAALEQTPGWQRLEGDPRGAVWTDQYSNILDVLNW